MNMDSSPRIAVMGAGAVGSYFGGMLARAGMHVTIIGRKPQVDAIVRNGLLLETLQFKEAIATFATIDPAAVSDAGLVLFCVKSIDTEEAARAIAPHLARDAVVLSLQNGVDNVERMRLHIGQRIIPAIVYVAAAITAPGSVRHSGRGDLIIGELEQPAGKGDIHSLQLEDLVALFAKAGVAVQISDNVEGELWAKLVTNCAYNAISALTRSNYGRLLATSHAREIMRDVVEEIEAVARAKGVRIPIDLEAVYGLADAMPAATSSTAQDIARGKRTEIDHLNGYIVRQGEKFGVPTPVNRTLHALVKLLEEAR
ncbi:MAG: 2-dehydropantoate 2-reductase [Alphaproteobacteria bacterium]|jgi:2-dehydropantoate 2-reductase|nr:2-dehydropantoate 2-reductase [Alphaproteobacteria bacterium]